MYARDGHKEAALSRMPLLWRMPHAQDLYARSDVPEGDVAAGLCDFGGRKHGPGLDGVAPGVTAERLWISGGMLRWGRRANQFIRLDARAFSWVRAVRPGAAVAVAGRDVYAVTWAPGDLGQTIELSLATTL